MSQFSYNVYHTVIHIPLNLEIDIIHYSQQEPDSLFYSSLLFVSVWWCLIGGRRFRKYCLSASLEYKWYKTHEKHTFQQMGKLHLLCLVSWTSRTSITTTNQFSHFKHPNHSGTTQSVAIVREALNQNGGREEDYPGFSFFATFFMPRLWWSCIRLWGWKQLWLWWRRWRMCKQILNISV